MITLHDLPTMHPFVPLGVPSGLTPVSAELMPRWLPKVSVGLCQRIAAPGEFTRTLAKPRMSGTAAAHGSKAEAMTHDGGRQQDDIGRRSDRAPIPADITLKRSGGSGYRTRAFDVSCHGCLLEFVVRPAIGEEVLVKFDGLEPLAATVRRIDGAAAGVEFRKQLHPAVFDHLIKKYQNN